MPTSEGIITALDLARREGHQDVATRIVGWCIAQRVDPPWDGTVGGPPVMAKLNSGRYVADCECQGAEYVDPDEPIFYCIACANHEHGPKARPVLFPPAAKLALLNELAMKRPVKELRGNNPIDRAFHAIPVAGVGWSRSWNPGQEPADLEQENQIAGIP